MENKINIVQPSSMDTAVLQRLSMEEARPVKPVSKSEGSSTRKLGQDKKEAARELDKTSSLMSSEKLQELTNEIQEYVKDLSISLKFELNDKTGDTVIQVVSQESGEVIRQIPPEDLLKLREKLLELQGALFEGKA